LDIREKSGEAGEINSTVREVEKFCRKNTVRHLKFSDE
jgi:hypothetical protein